MVTLAIPFLSMRLGSSDAGSDPPGTTTHQAYDLLAKGFGPGYNGPLQLVAEVTGTGQKQAFTKAVTAASRGPNGVLRSPPLLLFPATSRPPGRLYQRLPDRLSSGRLDQRATARTCATQSFPRPRPAAAYGCS